MTAKISWMSAVMPWWQPSHSMPSWGSHMSCICDAYAHAEHVTSTVFEQAASTVEDVKILREVYCHVQLACQLCQTISRDLPAFL